MPASSLGFWASRLEVHQVKSETDTTRFGQQILSFQDPDGMTLEIVPTSEPGGQPPTGGAVPAENAIRGFYGVTLSEEGYENTAKLLTDVMGFRPVGNERNRFRYQAAGGELASFVDVLCVPDSRRGGMGAGIVHHVAFRTGDDTKQTAWRAEIARLGYNVSPIMDRTYFRSIYFREPGGILFEIATDPPGFAVDESAGALGTKLKLPPQYESSRSQLERSLPSLKLPEWSSETRWA